MWDDEHGNARRVYYTDPNDGDALRSNPKHRSSLDRLRQEYALYTTVWQPIVFAAFAYLASAYMHGVQNGWTLSEGYVLVGALLLTPIFARLYIHKPDFPWLLGGTQVYGLC